jgi:predicted dehydrogenase
VANAIRVGLIGANVNAGWGSSVHTKVIQELPEFTLEAVGTAHRETAEESAKAFGARLAFDDYHELVRSPDIDAVAIAVRVPFHYEMAKAALEAGKHVYCEWPLTATLPQARELLELARSRGVAHVVGLQNRADPAYRTMRRLIDEGWIGVLTSVRMAQIQGGSGEREQRRVYQADPTLGAHVMSITAGHVIDSFRFGIGQDVASLVGQVRTKVPEWVVRETGERVATSSPDNVMLAGEIENGATVSITVAAVHGQGSGLTIEVHGTDGTLTLQSERGGLVLRGAHGSEREMAVLDLDEGDPVPEALKRGPVTNVARTYGRWHEAISTGAEVAPSFATAVEMHELLDAIARSSESGARVTVGTPRAAGAVL